MNMRQQSYLSRLVGQHNPEAGLMPPRLLFRPAAPIAQPAFTEIDTQEAAPAPPVGATKSQSKSKDGYPLEAPMLAREFQPPEKIALPSPLAALERVSLPAPIVASPAPAANGGENRTSAKVDQPVAGSPTVLPPPAHRSADGPRTGRDQPKSVGVKNSEMEKAGSSARVESRLIPPGETPAQYFQKGRNDSEPVFARAAPPGTSEPQRQAELMPAPSSQRQTPRINNIHQASPSERQTTVRIGSLHVRIHPPAVPAPQVAGIRQIAPRPTGTLSRGFRGFSFTQG